MRKSEIKRQTKETKVFISLNIDEYDPEKVEIKTGIGYLDHMLNLFAQHGRFGLVIKVKGDLEVDSHHTVEDTGIVLGQVFKKALGNKTGIERFGQQYVPMDESLSRVIIDLSGRSYLIFDSQLSAPVLGSLETETIEDFFQAFSQQIGANIHISTLYGRNTHHKIESIFKAFGRSLRQAVTINPNIKGVNSTKGML